MDNKKLALFLGMMCGDGCLTTRTKKQGYKSYSVEFYNTDISLVKLFDNLFYELFNTKGNFHPFNREGKKTIYEFRKYSLELFEKVSSFGFPKGVKRDKLRIPHVINDFSPSEKLEFFRGFLITDGCIRSNGTIIFHSGSKNFLEEFCELTNNLFGVNKKVKEYVQKEKYLSYQYLLSRLK